MSKEAELFEQYGDATISPWDSDHPVDRNLMDLRRGLPVMVKQTSKTTSQPDPWETAETEKKESW